VIHLATGIAVREGRLLMVASRYSNHDEPLWNLPGGRQLPGELLAETVVREVFEETGLHAEAREVAYVSESYDGDEHFLNVTFTVVLRQAEGDTSPLDSARGDTIAPLDSARGDTIAPLDSARGDTIAPLDSAWGDTAVNDHVAAVEWVPLAEVAERIVVAVVREPLLAYLAGSLTQRYAGFHDAGVTIEWPADSR
jgi:ADP-ribose pyrophosphatase YjhB (NUDIX family)